ncbi:MAG: 1-acyl-sn-glycerol-3-phosphate acyltransferase [Castellaniella sp.]|uniref:lysophospholipid acyltransferase family protein n=1 Tax=Castellaniella sp. TaxID=1955812 RepID=UPI001223553D|nr:lysophospholipid acyltransferase family protein [Castellaniella sp.]TAN28959.1 MAG: 1-acyl-sn-glycerol-3-phosphate acyltransferase [Castellaniella sp.]
MTFLRSLLFMIFLVVTVVPYAMCCVLWAPLPLAWRYRLTMGWPRMTLWAAKWILGIRYQARGLEHLPNGPAIILSKHQSAWETLYFAVSLPRDVVFVYKRELHHVPFFGWSLALLSMVPIDRTKGRESFEQVVRIGSQRLQEGRWPVLFPEGTRVAPGEEGRYKQGGALLACRTGTPVIPVAHNAGERWPRNAFLKTPGLVTVSFGPAISPAGYSPATLNRAVHDWIEAEMRVLNPERYAPH